jgi:membrane-associated PAP2 superfamily phosphatase
LTLHGATVLGIVFGARSRLGAKGGLIFTTGLVLLVANLIDLSAIASVGSAVALMVFLLVGAAGYRRRTDTGSNAALVLLAIAVTAIVLGFFAVDTLKNAPWTFVAIAGIALLAVVLDALVRRTGRVRPTTPAGANLPT